MDPKTFLLSLDELLELSPGTLKGDEILESLSEWNSLAVIGFIAMIDEDYSVTVASSKIKAAKTVGDLMKLVNDEIS
jgi:acyl carrier protein